MGIYLIFLFKCDVDNLYHVVLLKYVLYLFECLYNKIDLLI